MGLFEKIFGTHSEKELKKIGPIVDAIEALDEKMQALSDEELKAKTQEFKDRLAAGETLDDILVEAFAVVREAAYRVLGMKHYRVQLIGGIVLHQGRIAEMRTGEGKTLVSTLPAYLNALEGKGVHVVTVNDYLAKRDAEWMGQVHEFLGLKVGIILNSSTTDERRDAYNCDITYVTNNELGFDYLRDNMVIYKEKLVLRDLHYCVIDEVDSVLIDEARTPLIISGQSGKSTELYKMCDYLARQMKRGEGDGEISKMDMLMKTAVEEDGDFLVNEKDKYVMLTANGVKMVEQFFHIDNLSDPENMEIQHNIILALRAHNLMFRDRDYVVKDDEVLIVDEFTGRIMPGRRFSDGLHQAIEAKENVKVKRESKTLATITFQNFFNMFDKKAGMTGTAQTEEEEFREIYGMDVVVIPTNRPIQRIDQPDSIFKTKKEKLDAIVEQINLSYRKGQPVLVGTINIDASEELSHLLTKKKVPHKVLNAKFHELEAEIVADAGQKNAVTIATNMAGRGTDIMLGGNAEYKSLADLQKMGYSEEVAVEAAGFSNTQDEEVLAARAEYKKLYAKYSEEVKELAEKVREAGGLYIIGTERHESRRIDNQLRGRAGRQGDPGESRFFISLEDDLMRKFGGERVQSVMQTLGIEDDVPIENAFLTKTIESSQRKVEGRNFSIRKNVLDFDDVMSQQRMTIYSQRAKVLDGEDVSDYVKNMIKETIEENVKTYCSDDYPENWNLIGLREHFANMLTKEDDFNYTTDDLNTIDRKDIVKLLQERADALYAEREEMFGTENMREIERICLLKVVDTKWMDHIDAMEELKRGIYLRSYAQRDPVVEYRIEGFAMFDEMIAAIREDTARLVLTVKVRIEEPLEREQVMKPDAENAGSHTTVKKSASEKVGRNDPCPCGSGKKYKKCCGKDE